MEQKTQLRKYLFFAIIISCTFSSCFLRNPFEDETLVQVYPDTAVGINSLMPQICEVTIKSTDSTYHITKYWTDKLTGRIIYKMESDNHATTVPTATTTSNEKL